MSSEFVHMNVQAMQAVMNAQSGQQDTVRVHVHVYRTLQPEDDQTLAHRILPSVCPRIRDGHFPFPCSSIEPLVYDMAAYQIQSDGPVELSSPVMLMEEERSSG